MAIGVIQEQGDLGLGFNEITAEEEATLKQNSDIYHRSNEETNSEKDKGWVYNSTLIVLCN